MHAITPFTATARRTCFRGNLSTARGQIASGTRRLATHLLLASAIALTGMQADAADKTQMAAFKTAVFDLQQMAKNLDGKLMGVDERSDNPVERRRFELLNLCRSRTHYAKWGANRVYEMFYMASGLPEREYKLAVPRIDIGLNDLSERLARSMADLKGATVASDDPKIADLCVRARTIMTEMAPLAAALRSSP